MEPDFLKKAISEQIAAINEQLATILGHDQQVPQIEIDITMEYVRKLYSYLRELDRMSGPFKENIADIPKKSGKSSKKKSKSKQKEEAKSEPVVEKKKKPVVVQDKKTVIPQVKEPEEEVIQKSAVPVSMGVIAEKVLQETVSEQEDKKPVIDLFSGGSKTLADKLKNENGKRLADKIKEKQVTSLKNAIGINDKFLFINELFDGKLSDYNQAIKKFDECGSTEDCFNLVVELKDHYRWEEDSDPFLKLKEFIEKKHQPQAL